MVRYVPRLFEHVYTGTRTDRKKALEASDIGCLVRETEMSLQDGQSPNTRQKTKIFFVRFGKWEPEKPGAKIMKKPTRYMRLIRKVSK